MEPLNNETLLMVQQATNYINTCRIKNNLMDILAVRMLMLLLYGTVFVVAVSGNFLVVYVVMNNKRMQTVTNIFITNLAISDLLVNFTSLWLTPMYTYVGHWIWGGWLCHGLPLFQGTSIFISTLTLMAIAMDRYFVIVHHSSSLNINDRMSMRFIVPFVIIGISYHSIWSFLNGRRRLTRERAVETNRNILRDLHWDTFIRPHFSFIFLIVHLISMTATCWNPILYAWMNDSFREGFVKAIPFLRFKMKPHGRVRVQTAVHFISSKGNLGDCKAVTIASHLADDSSQNKEEKSNCQTENMRTFSVKSNEEKKFLQTPDPGKIEMVLTEDSEMQDNYLL
ncbi:7 transmembrane receptor [Oesophagostomum dentatum]|uniref:7 transmembrane receptor n=1 Tax=Oesophagostomum dentatum TaxID=61180 RepID=A0A0B1TTF1_OESDE|nr:7 transmembrane receptor [Oesophagostomum dentatum]